MNAAQRPPPWRDVRVRKWAFQMTVLIVVLIAVLYVWSNYQTNSQASRVPTGFDFLDQPANFPIAGSDFRTTQPVKDALGVGVANTLRVSIAGIVLATLIGTLVGIARLSKNWLVSKAAGVYVETLRNTPLLILVIFAYLAVALRLPPVSEAATPLPGFVASVRGIGVPWYRIDGSGWPVAGVLLAALLAAIAVRRWRLHINERSGARAHTAWWMAGTIVAVAVVGQLALGTPISGSLPRVDGRMVIGGAVMSPEMFALLTALTLYTASHIAEIVRGSIQAVPKGQGEAASALALSNGQRMWYVILPQAMRIAVPPLANQYLNLTKNSSLGVAVSYMELTKVSRTAIANASPAIPMLVVVLSMYLVLSIAISLLTNLLNRRLKVVER